MALHTHGKIKHVNMDAIDNGVMVRWTELFKGADKGTFDEMERNHHELAFVDDQVDAGFDKFKEMMKIEMAQMAEGKVDAGSAHLTLEVKAS